MSWIRVIWEKYPRLGLLFQNRRSRQGIITSKFFSLIIYIAVSDKGPSGFSTEDVLKAAAENPELLVPVRVEVDTDTHRIRDCFVWNLNG